MNQGVSQPKFTAAKSCSCDDAVLLGMLDLVVLIVTSIFMQWSLSFG